ncbi:MAG: PilZ domain-containing protein [Nitrospiraceae bacterium]|nr:PilZ domain-containing protein [Nitrospiraceae bacterium]
MMEQRKNLRFHVQFRSSFSSIAMVGGEGTVVDLSIRGCRIDSPIDVQPGASLEVRIAAIEHEPPIQIQQALVRWSRGRQFGLEFVTMTPEEWARLQHTVSQIEMEPYERDKQATERNEYS